MGTHFFSIRMHHLILNGNLHIFKNDYNRDKIVNSKFNVITEYFVFIYRYKYYCNHFFTSINILIINSLYIEKIRTRSILKHI